jgi:hypothetical protein
METDELCIFPSIHTKAEEIKKQLTYSSEVQFSCHMPGDSRRIVFPVYREKDFIQGCSTLFEKSLVPVRRLLTDLGKEAECYPLSFLVIC